MSTPAAELGEASARSQPNTLQSSEASARLQTNTLNTATATANTISSEEIARLRIHTMSRMAPDAIITFNRMHQELGHAAVLSWVNYGDWMCTIGAQPYKNLLVTGSQAVRILDMFINILEGSMSMQDLADYHVKCWNENQDKTLITYAHIHHEYVPELFKSDKWTQWLQYCEDDNREDPSGERPRKKPRMPDALPMRRKRPFSDIRSNRQSGATVLPLASTTPEPPQSTSTQGTVPTQASSSSPPPTATSKIIPFVPEREATPVPVKSNKSSKKSSVGNKQQKSSSGRKLQRSQVSSTQNEDTSCDNGGGGGAGQDKAGEVTEAGQYGEGEAGQDKAGEAVEVEQYGEGEAGKEGQDDTEAAETANPDQDDTEAAEIANPGQDDTEAAETVNPDQDDKEAAETVNPDTHLGSGRKQPSKNFDNEADEEEDTTQVSKDVSTINIPPLLIQEIARVITGSAVHSYTMANAGNVRELSEYTTTYQAMLEQMNAKNTLPTFLTRLFNAVDSHIEYCTGIVKTNQGTALSSTRAHVTSPFGHCQPPSWLHTLKDAAEIGNKIIDLANQEHAARYQKTWDMSYISQWLSDQVKQCNTRAKRDGLTSAQYKKQLISGVVAASQLVDTGKRSTTDAVRQGDFFTKGQRDAQMRAWRGVDKLCNLRKGGAQFLVLNMNQTFISMFARNELCVSVAVSADTMMAPPLQQIEQTLKDSAGGDFRGRASMYPYNRYERGTIAESFLPISALWDDIAHSFATPEEHIAFATANKIGHEYGLTLMSIPTMLKTGYNGRIETSKCPWIVLGMDDGNLCVYSLKDIKAGDFLGIMPAIFHYSQSAPDYAFTESSTVAQDAPNLWADLDTIPGKLSYMERVSDYDDSDAAMAFHQVHDPELAGLPSVALVVFATRDIEKMQKITLHLPNNVETPTPTTQLALIKNDYPTLDMTALQRKRTDGLYLMAGFVKRFIIHATVTGIQSSILQQKWLQCFGKLQVPFSFEEFGVFCSLSTQASPLPTLYNLPLIRGYYETAVNLFPRNIINLNAPYLLLSMVTAVCGTMSGIPSAGDQDIHAQESLALAGSSALASVTALMEPEQPLVPRGIHTLANESALTAFLQLFAMLGVAQDELESGQWVQRLDGEENIAAYLSTLPRHRYNTEQMVDMLYNLPTHLEGLLLQINHVGSAVIDTTALQDVLRILDPNLSRNLPSQGIRVAEIWRSIISALIFAVPKGIVPDVDHHFAEPNIGREWEKTLAGYQHSPIFRRLIMQHCSIGTCEACGRQGVEIYRYKSTLQIVVHKDSPLRISMDGILRQLFSQTRFPVSRPPCCEEEQTSFTNGTRLLTRIPEVLAVELNYQVEDAKVIIEMEGSLSSPNIDMLPIIMPILHPVSGLHAKLVGVITNVTDDDDSIGVKKGQAVATILEDGNWWLCTPDGELRLVHTLDQLLGAPRFLLFKAQTPTYADQ